MGRTPNPKYEFNPLADREVPRSKASEAREAVKEFVLEKVKEYVDKGVSPVDGEKWAGLSPKYKKLKRGAIGSSKADLQLTGEMLEALDIRVKGNKLTILVNDNSQAGKSDGHNNHSGKSELPLRRFIPEEGEGFVSEIEDGIDEIISEFEEESKDER